MNEMNFYHVLKSFNEACYEISLLIHNFHNISFFHSYIGKIIHLYFPMPDGKKYPEKMKNKIVHTCTFSHFFLFLKTIQNNRIQNYNICVKIIFCFASLLFRFFIMFCNVHCLCNFNFLNPMMSFILFHRTWMPRERKIKKRIIFLIFFFKKTYLSLLIKCINVET